jgi:DNA-binding NtrC family response regulator
MSTRPVILAVDDDLFFRDLLEQQLHDIGYTPVMAASAGEALAILEHLNIDLILSDLVMPDIDGMEFLEQVNRLRPDIPFIIITAHASIAGTVEAMRRGAYNYVDKLCEPDELRIVIERALAHQLLRSEHDQLKGHLREKFSFQSIITTCPVMKTALELAARVTTSPQTTVVIYGESGCGKEVLSRAIHFAGGGMPVGFVAVNCAAIPEALLESELFGHVRGAFTGADREREGKFSQARGGTLLLDEIGDMPLGLQAKLLRVLEGRTFEKVGSNEPIPVNCRVIVATNRDLPEMIATGHFREDLFHRINVYPITIPPLRERRDDIPLLVEHFLAIFRQHQGKPLPGISQKALDELLTYRWPGNIRELRNCLERAAIVCDGLIQPEHLSICSCRVNSSGGAATETNVPAGGAITYHFALQPDKVSLEEVNRRVLDITLEWCQGNKSQAAALLKVSRNKFYR